MSLPKIESYPTKTVTLPMSKKKIKIRPFLVKEEKILIMVRENENATPDEQLEAICQVIGSCTIDDVSPLEFNEVDLSYLFMQIRMMSKGETSKVTYKCKATVREHPEAEPEECGTALNVNIDLNNVEAYQPEGYKDLFKLPGSDIHIKMKMPTMADILALQSKGVDLANASNAKWSQLEAIVVASIESIIQGDQNDSVVYKDFTEDEMKEWLEGVHDTVLEDIIENYLQKMPYLRYEVKMQCPNCGTKHEFDITGIENFFA